MTMSDLIGSLAAGSVLVLCGILLFCFWSIIFRGPLQDVVDREKDRD